MSKKAYSAAWYQANKERIAQKSKARFLERRTLIDNAKSVPCADCKNKFDPVCMDFDHRPGEEKVVEVGKMLSYRIDVLLAEIAKCDVVCSNCHRLRTKGRGYGSSNQYT